ncbi:conserved hypothetical protein [Microsporum canis CBS 113480]|uniref:Uncharacterized protein n=1 Tax=Arthroderma otae (strain ATCC MYA-4605 / CBS 113480) TaxID=554155 RepID=C5FMI7_ARTOC|nr:conserved hypothetical protein [Microsporum canis CBS 113480]EEQ31090.1 conserved hypothetical protein [Microsporum canis CBS 113480]
MEVTKRNFTQLLPQILQAIGDCSFVALDFEFSGIFNQKLRPASSYADGDLSLQKRYEEVKQAAEEYQILQVGITLVTEDSENGTYLLRPYNIPLSPLLDPRLEVERKWSFQNSDGVPYISRKEEEDAMVRVRQHNSAISPINLDTLAADQAEFLRQVRQDVKEWIEKDGPKDGYLNIPKPAGMTDAHKLPLELDNYQKRLVHQIINSEYPGYVSVGKKSFVQIIPYDAERENKVTEKKLQIVRANITSQKGLSWVIEALTGGELARLDLRLLWRPDGMFTAAEGSMLTKRSEALREKLRAGPPVLVGHNLFTDLVNFYKCFIGDLPGRVEDFQQAIHELFPVVVDTKYMATHGGVLRDAFSALSKLNETLGAREVPNFETDSEHSAYIANAPQHEAGYDSLITAQVFLKLAVQLFETSTSREALIHRTNGDATEIDLMDLSTEPEEPTKNDTKETETQKKLVYGHATKFDLLLSMEDEESSSGSTGPSSEQESLIVQKVIEGKLLPRFDDEFWAEYVNKLRVFGTSEEVCDLCGRPAALDSKIIN